MHVALCQIPVSSRPEVNSGRVRDALAEAADRGADLAVFPEATQVRFGSDLRAAAGSVLYLTLVALIALGAATAVRDSAVAIGLVLGLLYLFPIVSAVIGNQHWQRHLEQASPMTAGLYIQVTAGVRFATRAPAGRMRLSSTRRRSNRSHSPSRASWPPPFIDRRRCSYSIDECR